ncbi:hypothetical protein AB0H12_29660 [Actinosynnema sp. NPDC023794]
MMRRQLLTMTFAAVMTVTAVGPSTVTAAPTDDEQQVPLFVAADREIASTLQIAVCIIKFDPASGKGEYGVSTLSPKDTPQGTCAVVPAPLPPTNATEGSALGDAKDDYLDGAVIVNRDGQWSQSAMAYADSNGDIRYTLGQGYVGPTGVHVHATEAGNYFESENDRATVDPGQGDEDLRQVPQAARHVTAPRRGGQHGSHPIAYVDKPLDLVALNHFHPAMLDYLTDVMNHWLARGASGWRLVGLR